MYQSTRRLLATVSTLFGMLSLVAVVDRLNAQPNPTPSVRPTLAERPPTSPPRFSPPMVRILPQISSIYVGSISNLPTNNSNGMTSPYMGGYPGGLNSMLWNGNFNNPMGMNFNGFNNPMGMNINGFNPGLQMNGLNGLNGLPLVNPNNPRFGGFCGFN